MSIGANSPRIQLRGVRQHNLKNLDLDLPIGRLIVITGPSGSGKSSLAFDTLFAEGQRRYIETFSPYARQFFDRMDKPQVDRIEGIPPAVAIEQRNSVRTTRSTVGTMTEICDYLKVLWPKVARLYCRQCGQVVQVDSPQGTWKAIRPEIPPGTPPPEALLTFDLPLSDKLSLDESLALIGRQGYQRLLMGREVYRIDEAAPRLALAKNRSLRVVQDRIKLSAANRARFVEGCEQAFHFGKGKLAVHLVRGSAADSSPAMDEPRFFSNRYHCARCDLDYREPSPALFSFNHPLGACPACRGFGRIITIDYDLALPDRTKTLTAGVVKPWQTGMSAECQDDMLRFCRLRGVPTDVAFTDLPRRWQDWVINGDPDYGQDKRHEWPNAWYGIKGYFRWLESKSYKMHVRVLLSRYRAYLSCPDCQGKRLQPEALLYRVVLPPATPSPPIAPPARLSLADFYQLAVRDALVFLERLAKTLPTSSGDPLRLAWNEVRSRLAFLDEVGLGYLTLDRPTRSLSGGETERVNLTTCLGTHLVNTLFVLDEPSVGLHPRDTTRLVAILERLRDTGNTVVVVEHEPCVIRAADHIVDLGPGHGESGGSLVFQGSYAQLRQSNRSLTGQYLAGKKRIAIPTRRPVRSPAPQPAKSLRPDPILRLAKATLHNLRDFSVTIPLQRLVCVTGVSGSGKTTLVRNVLLPALQSRLQNSDPGSAAVGKPAGADHGDHRPATNGHAVTLFGWEHLGRVVFVDQSLLGKTPRSNPAVYIGAFDHIRELYARSEVARQKGLGASAFSFNSTQGQCQRCRGAGFDKIEMQFLSDVYVRCPDCNGRRYRSHILEITVGPKSKTKNPKSPKPAWSIADLLEATIDEAVDFLGAFADALPARRARESLALMQDVGLGYLRLGQPINTLSGGESQRLKLVSCLAEETGRTARPRLGEAPRGASTTELRPTLFLFDEPTTGLHFDDIRILLAVFHRLVDAGHSIVVVEHNLEVIKSADWLIDMGPEAGDAGGLLVVAGPPETVAACASSHTGQFLKPVLESRP